MKENLAEILNAYRLCTLEIIEVVKSDNLDLLPKLVEDREELVKKSLKIKCDEEMKKLYNEFALEELQQELNTLMEGKLSFIKEELEKMNKSKVVNGAYNKANFVNAKIFNKKI